MTISSRSLRYPQSLTQFCKLCQQLEANKIIDQRDGMLLDLNVILPKEEK